MYVCSYYKRTLDTSSRYKYIVSAYANMKRWIREGTDDVQKKKRHIHRHLALPKGGYDDEGKELLEDFAFQYVQALLTYCGDDMKTGMCLALSVILYLTLTVIACLLAYHTPHQGITL